MKKIIILFLVLGLVFSASFPQEISGSTLEIDQQSGDTQSGEVAYYNSDKSIGGWVVATPMTYSEFVSFPYEDEGWTKTDQAGMECYYSCDLDTDEIGDYSYCYMDCHKDGAYITIDTYISDGEISDSLYEGLAIANTLSQTGGQDYNGGSNNQGNNNQANNQQDDGSSKGNSICPALGMVLLIGGFVVKE